MKAALAVTTFLLLSGFPLSGQAVAAQAPAHPGATTQRVQVAAPAVNLNATLEQIQQATNAAKSDLGRLRIEKWKTDAEQRQQLLVVSDSVQKNITNAVPGMIDDVQSSRGSVLSSFKLYHNLNVLYEYLSSLADAAGVLGKKDEYEPLAADAAALDTARQSLSTYIEQAAGKLEASARPPGGATPTQGRQAPTPTPTPQKVIVIDEGAPKPSKPVKPSKKKTSAPPATPSASPSSSPR